MTCGKSQTEHFINYFLLFLYKRGNEQLLGLILADSPFEDVDF